MRLFRQLQHGLRVLFRRHEADQDLEDESRHYFDEAAADLQARGVSAEEARRMARLEFGSTLAMREQVRDAAWESRFASLCADTRFAARRLARHPGFALAAIATLALGIGATTTIFSIIDGVLLRPLPYPQSNRIVALVHTAPGIDLKEIYMSPSLYFTYREENHVFDGVAIWNGGRSTVTGLSEPEEASTLFVTHEFLPILRVNPALGRGFRSADDEWNSTPTVLISDAFWKSHFGGSRAVLGKRLILDGNAHEVIGVLPPRFEFLDENVSLIVLRRLRRSEVKLISFSEQGIARLKPGVTLRQANADVARCLPLVVTKFGREQPSIVGFTATKIAPTLRLLKDDLIGDLGTTLWLVMGSVALLLLTACANVANLLLVRADARHRELAVRAALGANWSRIATDLLLESLLLGGAAALVSLGICSVALAILQKLPFLSLPRFADVTVDRSTIVFAATTALVMSLVFGLIPVWKYASPHILEAMHTGSGRSATESLRRRRSRTALVVVQVSLAAVLLITSVLMLRTFQKLRSVDPGFSRPDQVQAVRISIPQTQQPNPAQVLATQKAILKRFETVPGVTAVSLTTSLPLEGGSNNPVFVEGRSYQAGTIPPLRRMRSISPDFSAALGKRLVAGRDFRWDELQRAAPVALISENMARELWNSPEAALGKRIREDSHYPWQQVVGVLPDLHDNGLNQPPPAIVYWPLMQRFTDGQFQISRNVDYLIRSSRAGSAALIQDLRLALRSVNANLPLANVRTLESTYKRALARTSLALLLMGVAGAMALVLGVVGIYAVVAYSVSLRRRDIGIRIALGCSSRSVVRMFLLQGLSLSAGGAACGLCFALLSTRWLKSLLFGIDPLDPLSFAVVLSSLVLAALLASWLPARRAAAVDPSEALRAE